MSATSSRNYRNQPAMTQHGSVVWFISFGDLLTLLLCFFLVLTPWKQLNQRSQDQSSPPVKSKNVVAGGIGTTLADELPERGFQLLREVPIFARELESLDELVLGSLEQALEEVEKRIVRVEVLVCGAAEEQGQFIYRVSGTVGKIREGNFSTSYQLAHGCQDRAVLAPVNDKTVGRVRILGLL